MTLSSAIATLQWEGGLMKKEKIILGHFVHVSQGAASAVGAVRTEAIPSPLAFQDLTDCT